MIDHHMEMILDGRRNPVDQTAANVIKGGVHWDKDARGTEVCDENPLPMMKPAPDAPKLIGFRFGYMTVVGFSAERTKMWVCKCLCGRYTYRSTKAIRNQKNSHDGCVRCRQKMFRARNRLWQETGRNIDWNQIPGYEKP